MIFTALRNLLLADPSFTAVIGDRVYMMQAPGGKPQPDVIQYPSSGTMQSGLEGTTPPWTRRISFECRDQRYGDDAGGAHMVGDHIIRILNNYVGTRDGENIHAIQLVSDVPDVDEQSALKRRIIDFRVMHSPA